MCGSLWIGREVIETAAQSALFRAANSVPRGATPTLDDRRTPQLASKCASTLVKAALVILTKELYELHKGDDGSDDLRSL